MEKSQPPSYYNPPSAPNADYTVGGQPPPTTTGEGAYQQGANPPQENYPPGYQPGSGYQPQPPNSEQQPLSMAQQTYGTVPVSPVIPRYSWWQDVRRNSPQSKSLSADTLIFASGGMSLLWGIGFSPDFAHLGDPGLAHVEVCWFIAVIIGACVVTIIKGRIVKRVLNLIASTLVLANGVLLVAAGNRPTAVIIARYCDGFAFGLTVVPFIVAGSEQAQKRFRGYVLSCEHIGLAVGMNLFLTISRSNSTQGIMAILFGGFAMIFTYVYTSETAISFLRKGDELEAINVLRLSQRPYTLTAETYAQLHENKHLLEEDIARGCALNVSNGILPIAKLGLFRAFVAMSLSIPLVWGFILDSIFTNPDADLWRFSAFTSMRLVGVVFGLYSLDTLGRKPVSVTALLIGGGLMIGIGSLFSSYASTFESVNTSKGLLMAYEWFAGLAAPASTCYLGEAFSISVKPYFVLIAIVLENLIQIVICSAFNGQVESIAKYGYVLGTLQIAFGLVFLFGIPETKGTTLREALEQFKKPVTVGDRVRIM